MAHYVIEHSLASDRKAFHTEMKILHVPEGHPQAETLAALSKEKLAMPRNVEEYGSPEYNAWSERMKQAFKAFKPRGKYAEGIREEVIHVPNQVASGHRNWMDLSETELEKLREHMQDTQMRKAA